MIKKYKFLKKQKLLLNKQFNLVFNKLEYFSFDKQFIIIGCINNLNYSRIGIIVPKKNIKKSFQRNKIKRLIREYFRLNRNKFFFMDYIILVKVHLSKIGKINFKIRSINNNQHDNVIIKDNS
ncbi:MAG: ribonuclease P protein component [Candidatus Lightella neohaematopini]|nr:ribonuclease P protein component [Candidatus Lightella neohaematopini]